MNYFSFHIGDYAAATLHLSLIEDAVFQRLLRKQYLEEKALPADLKQCARLAGARTEQEIEAVQVVLAEFFELTEEGYINKRAMAEVKAYHEKSDKAKASVSKRWDNERNTNVIRLNAERNSNQEPITNNQEPIVLIQEAKASLSSAVPTEDQKPIDLPKKQADIPDCPHQKLLQLYQKHLPHLAQPRVWEGTRQKHLQARWRQCASHSTFSEGYSDESGGLKFWDSLFNYIARDTKLSEGYESNGRSWRPDLPWIVKPENFQKIVDGKYELQDAKANTR